MTAVRDSPKTDSFNDNSLFKQIEQTFGISLLVGESFVIDLDLAQSLSPLLLRRSSIPSREESCPTAIISTSAAVSISE